MKHQGPHYLLMSGTIQMLKWQKASVTAIAKTLADRFDFDPDRAVAIAYWFKKGRLITTMPGRYWNRFPVTMVLRDMTSDDAIKLLNDYAVFKNSDKCK